MIGVAVASFLSLGWSEFRVFQGLENLSQDLRTSRFNPGHVASPDVVVVDIDDPSMKFMNEHYGYGRWPLPRVFYKDLLEFLRLSQAKAIYFDVLFSERQNGGTDDQSLAEILKAMPEVSMAMLFEKDAAIELRPGERAVALPSSLLSAAELRIESRPVVDPKLNEKFGLDLGFRDFLSPQEPLLSATSAFHVVNTEIDWDGRFRREPLVLRYDGKFFPSLALAAVQKFYANSKGAPSLTYEDGKLAITPAGETSSIRKIPIRKNGLMDIGFYSRANEPKTLPVAPIIQSAELLKRGEVEDPASLPVRPDEFKDKIVLIGTSAVGAADLKDTPVDVAQPGVLLHADAISNILTGKFTSRPRGIFLKAIEVALSLLLAAITYWSVFRLSSPLARFAIPLLSLVSVLGASIAAYRFGDLMLPFMLPAIIVVLALGDSFSYMLFVEGRERKRMQENLSKYLPPAVIEEMIASGNDLRAEVGKKETVSILFSDIRGFTTLSEQLSPEVVVAILNEYLDTMTRVIFAHGGTLDKFIGDAIMAFWGAPIVSSAHAADSVAGAMAMVEELQALRQRWSSRAEFKGIHLEIGVGINTGEVVVGNIGGEKKLDYTVIGDNVNLASRLEGLTKQYGVTLIIAETTYQKVREQVICRVVDRVRVKGKKNSVTIYEPLARRDAVGAVAANALAAAFERDFKLYCEGNFAEALPGFQSGTDKLAQLYVTRCQQYLKDGIPPQWDGTYVAQSK